MLRVRVRVRNMEVLAVGNVPILAEIRVGEEVLPPSEEREFEFTEENDLVIKAVLTEEGQKAKEEIEKADAEIVKDRETGPQPLPTAKGEKKEGGPPVSPAPKVEGPAQSSGPPVDSRDVKGQPPLRR